MMKPLFVRGHFAPLKDNQLYPLGKILVNFPDPENLLVERVDHRDFASVYFVNYHQQKLVLKWMYLDDDNSITAVENEINIHLKVTACGLAPSLRYAFLFQLGGVLVTDRLDIELGTYLIKNVNTIEYSNLLLAEMVALVKKLHRLEISHGDLGVCNMMFKYVQIPGEERRRVSLQFIDFGYSRDLSLESTETIAKLKRLDYVTLAGDIYDMYGDFGYPHLEDMFLKLQALSEKG